MNSANAILVMGSGRSGTSLGMQFLDALGVCMSPEMTPPSPQNPEGGWEDVDILALHRKLLQLISSNPHLPLPENWQQQPAMNGVKAQLKALLSTRTSACNGRPWAIKDPNLAMFLPLLLKVFNEAKILASNILCVRHPESVARSMKANYGHPTESSDMIWMLRNAYALIHSGGNCLMLHYEDWESKPAQQLQALAKFAGSAQGLDDDRINQLLGQIFDNKLNRSGYIRDPHIANPHVKRFYDALRAVPGGTVCGREAVLAAENCLEAVNQFRGMAVVAWDALKQANKMRKKLDEFEKGDGISHPLASSHPAAAEIQADLTRAMEENQALAKHVRFLEGLVAQQREQMLDRQQ